MGGPISGAWVYAEIASQFSPALPVSGIPLQSGLSLAQITAVLPLRHSAFGLDQVRAGSDPEQNNCKKDKDPPFDFVLFADVQHMGCMC